MTFLQHAAPFLLFARVTLPSAHATKETNNVYYLLMFSVYATPAPPERIGFPVLTHVPC